MRGYKYRYTVNPEKGVIYLKPTLAAFAKAFMPFALFGAFLMVVGTILEFAEKRKPVTELDPEHP